MDTDNLDRTERLARYLRRLAHDIRNASSLLTLNLDMLRQEVNTGRARACLEDSDEAIRRLESMSQDLSRSLSPVETNAEPCDLRVLTEQAIDTVLTERTREAAPALAFAPNIQGEARGVGPATFFRASIGIILANAFDAIESTDGGRPEVSIRLAASPLTVTVKNNGPAIEPDLVSDIFEPFVSRVSHTRFRSGLGLTRARRFAQRVNGEVALEENGPSGVCFRVRANPNP
ncbi:MAG: HAMP domain-containing sensor histidine kinase [Myxococcota bacterium]